MIGDVYRLTVNSAMYGSRIANVFHYKVDTDALSGTNEADIIERFKAGVLPDWINILSNDFVIDCLTVSKLGAGAAAPVVEVLSSGNVGTVAEDALPPNKCYLVSFQSATFTRRGRGRKFLAGVPESYEDDNCIEAAFKTDCELVAIAMANDLTGGSGGGTYSAAIWSQVAGSAQNVRHVDFHPQVHQLRGRTAVRC